MTKLIQGLSGDVKARLGLVFVLYKFWVKTQFFFVIVIEEQRVVIKLVFV